MAEAKRGGVMTSENDDAKAGPQDMYAQLKNSPGRRGKKEKASPMEGSISDRHLSPALRTFPADRLKIAPLTGVKATIYSRLWRPIADGRVKTGLKIVDAELERVFGFSRPVTRSVLENMAGEGYVTIQANRTPFVAELTPEQAFGVFETLKCAMTYIVHELASPSRKLTSEQRGLLDLHLKAQSAADEAGERIDAHLLGVEFLVLLAAIHGVTLLTDLVARAIVLETLALKAYGEFPPPPWYVAFQRELLEKIFAHNPAEAVAVFNARLEHVRGTLRISVTKAYEHDDLAHLLSGEAPRTER
jgi:DNA-binding GntR family transcriptional regulator